MQLPLGCTFWLITRRVETKLALMFQSEQEQDLNYQEIRNISQITILYTCLQATNYTPKELFFQQT